jgi:hypothetical protein
MLKMVHENIKVIFDVENEHDPEFVGVTVTEEVEFYWFKCN